MLHAKYAKANANPMFDRSWPTKERAVECLHDEALWAWLSELLLIFPAPLSSTSLLSSNGASIIRLPTITDRGR